MALDEREKPYMSIWFIGRIEKKFIALFLLVAQTVGAIVFMRISRINSYGPSKLLYLNTTAVVMSEIFKLIGSLALVFYEASFSLEQTISLVDSVILKRPYETFKVGVPAFLYTIQNNLIFIALSNISVALYQVTYQLKILTTAILSVLLLGKRLGFSKWLSLLVLTMGVILIQLPSANTSKKSADGNLLTGLSAIMIACLTSGFAGVYFEKILKGSATSIWLRNVQLSIYGILLGILGAWIHDGEAIRRNGVFQGYTCITWVVILLQSAGGLIVAAVLKYADNILKCFGNALAIVLSCLCSYYFIGDVELSFLFAVGTALVIFASYSYGTELKLASLFFMFQQKKLSSQLSFQKVPNRDEDSLPLSVLTR